MSASNVDPGFSGNLALEVARKGTTVNCAVPGAIVTERLAAVPKVVLDGMLEKIPMQRLGIGEDISRAVLFVGDAASYLAGQAIPVSSGWGM